MNIIHLASIFVIPCVFVMYKQYFIDYYNDFIHQPDSNLDICKKKYHKEIQIQYHNFMKNWYSL